MSMTILAAGLLSSVQGGARNGWRHLGIGGSGAVDTFSCSVANLLVGNATDAAVIEVTLTGPRIHCSDAVRIAICGAEINVSLDGEAVPNWRRVDIPAGSELRMGACRRGARAYLAVAGGFAVQRVLGNQSTDLRAGFGGIDGRALQAGDSLIVANGFRPRCDRLDIDSRWIDPLPDLDLSIPPTIHVLPGADALAESNTLFDSEWRIGSASNRQGLRLEGVAMRTIDGSERISEPVFPGTLQLPPDGQPIVLLADAQTHGGYPRIGHAIRADWPRLAQLRPGDSLRFARCDGKQAQARLAAQRQRIARMAVAIAAQP